MEENIFSIVDIIVKEILISCAKIWCGFYVNLDGFWFYFPYFDHLAHLCTFIKEELKLSISSYKQSRWIAMVCVEHDVDIENLRNWDRKTTTVKTFLVNMMTKMMKLVMNLENPWSPLSSGERCKCEGHFSDLKDGHDYGQRGHGHQNVTSRSRLFTWEIHISYLKS